MPVTVLADVYTPPGGKHTIIFFQKYRVNSFSDGFFKKCSNLNNSLVSPLDCDQHSWVQCGMGYKEVLTDLKVFLSLLAFTTNINTGQSLEHTLSRSILPFFLFHWAHSSIDSFPIPVLSITVHLDRKLPDWYLHALMSVLPQTNCTMLCRLLWSSSLQILRNCGAEMNSGKKNMARGSKSSETTHSDTQRILRS